ncbi:J domain-containing protein [Noviherbaspirillum massiliense]|uniref:J domain-containing protein n=1 Tax=Noviherbaspirillum massiliense TaxID=1465823 RepID=UPI0003012980
MARIHTHYDNLKVARNAPPEVIRAAYKTLSQKYHPDRNPNSADAIRIIQIINSAYEVLSDPVKRQEHDEWIARAEAQEAATERKSSRPAGGTTEKKAQDVRRRSGSGRRRSSRQPALKPVKFFQKLRMLLGHFSRSLFRKV